MEVLNNLLIEYSLCIHLTGLSMLGHRLQDEGRHRRVDHLEGASAFLWTKILHFEQFEKDR